MGDQEQQQVEAGVPIAAAGPPSTRLNLNLQPPTDLDLKDKHRAENWKAFKQRWNHYSVLTQLDKQPEDYKVALFLYSVGGEAVKTFNTFDLTEDNKGNLGTIIAAFDKFAIGEKNETYERYKFNSRDQKENESISAYITELRMLAQTCNFCTCLNDSLIRDRIVLGVRDNEIRKRLLQKKKLSLSECIDMCLASEVTKTQLKALDKQGSEETIHDVKQAKKAWRKRDKPDRPRQRSEEAKRDTANKSSRPCRYCGRTHKVGREHCPVWGKFCAECGKKNQFADVCLQECKRKAETHGVSEDIYESTSDSDYMGCVTVKLEAVNGVDDSKSPAAEPIYAEMLVNGSPVKFHIDCGASVNVLPMKYVNKQTLKPTNKTLVMWNKTELKPKGTKRLTIRNPKTNTKHKVEFVIVEENLMPLLGSSASQNMNIIKVKHENFKSVSSVRHEQPTTYILGDKADVIARYADVFNGDLGTLEGKQHLTVDPDVTPTVSPSRRLPFAMRSKLQAELDRLTDLGVVAPVDEPTDWVSNVVIATKPSGDLRICIDPKPLNKALKRERYPIPVIDDVLPELAKAKIFTKIDAKNGYWHVVLDDDSAKLTTFDTPFGRYRWKRLPFGLSVASEIFQK